MKYFLHYRFVLFVLLALLSTSLQAQQGADTVDLRPRFIAGQQARYSLWTRRNTQTQVTILEDVRQQDGGYVVEGEASWQVLLVDPDGSAQCQMTFDWFSLTIDLPDGTQQVNDTRTGANQSPGVYEVISAMVDNPVTFTMAADGSATAVFGTQAMRSAAGADVELPGDLDFIESASDLATLPFAPANASVNQSWDSSFRWSHELGHMNYAVESTLTSVGSVHGIDLATITSTGEIALDVDYEKLPKDENLQLDVTLEEGSFEQQVFMDMDRHEAVGRNSVLRTVIHTTMNSDDYSVSQVVRQTVHSQALRISETDVMP